MNRNRLVLVSSLALSMLLGTSAANALCPTDLPANGGCPSDLTHKWEKTTESEYDYINGSAVLDKALDWYLEISIDDNWNDCGKGPAGVEVASVEINLEMTDTDTASVEVGYKLKQTEQAEANVELIGKVGISMEQEFSIGAKLETKKERKIGKKYTVKHFGCTKGAGTHKLFGKKNAKASGDAAETFKWHDKCDHWWFNADWGPEQTCRKTTKANLTAPTGCATFNRVDENAGEQTCAPAELTGTCAPKPCAKTAPGLNGMAICVEETADASAEPTTTEPTTTSTSGGPAPAPAESF